MRVKVDMESDALYFRLCDDPTENSEEVVPGIIVDYNKEGEAIGIEILGIMERIPFKELSHMEVDLPTAA